MCFDNNLTRDEEMTRTDAKNVFIISEIKANIIGNQLFLGRKKRILNKGNNII